MKKLLALTMLYALTLSTSLASAADSDWYIGASGGGSNFGGHAEDVELSLAGESHVVTRFEGGGKGWKLFVGKQLLENLAIELAYTDMGKFSYNADIGSLLTSEYGQVRPVCWNMSAVGILPLGNSFSLLGKAGLCRWDDRVYAYEVGGPVYPSGSVGTNLNVGIGAKYEVNNRLAIKAEWERYNKVVHNRNGVDMLSLGLQYGFN